MTLNNQGFYNLTIDNTSAGGSDNVTIDDDLDVGGKFTLTDGDFNAGSYSINIAGDYESTGGSFNAGTSTIVFDGNGWQTVTTNDATFNDMILATSTTVQFLATVDKSSSLAAFEFSR